MANRWLPNADNFVSIVQTTLLRARQQLGSGGIDCPQYWITKLETFKETFTLFKAQVFRPFLAESIYKNSLAI